jgi:glutamine---fructose-6-phosphate transaminase (isomerizing)
VCSIIGYSGSLDAAPIILKGLQRMEYRGYDSAGIATLNGGSITVRKGVGKVAQVNGALHLDHLEGNIGVGHTRWATHGGVTDANAHPHLSCTGGVAIVHNGIIDNHEDLRQMLIGEGYPFRSETDSEAIANLLQLNLDRTRNPLTTLRRTVKQLDGNYSFAALFPDGTIGAARFHEPLMVGVGKNGYYLASDVLGFVEQTDRVIYVENRELVLIKGNVLEIQSFDGSLSGHPVARVPGGYSQMDKGDFVHHTLKEISEQPMSILKAGEGSEQQMMTAADLMKSAGKVYITGCGSSYNAALVGKYMLAKYAKLHLETIIASEAKFTPIDFSDSVVIAISQSGETADVLEAVGMAKENGAKVVSMVNVVTSSLAHLSDVTIGLNCGPEIGVAATKSFTSQVAVLYKLTDILSGGQIGPAFAPLSSRIAGLVASPSTIKDLAESLLRVRDIYILGRGVNYSIAAEASLKLKELAYVHAEALPGGELKHGPLALLDPHSLVIILNPSDMTYQDTLASAHEVKARGAKVVGVSDKRNDLYDQWVEIPPVDEKLYPFVEVIPLQLLAYYLAVGTKADPDYPRNLAKSVTVK